MNSIGRDRLLVSVALFAWMGVIFGFSSMHGATEPNSLPLWKLIERKGAHVFEYFVLAGLAFHWLRLHAPGMRFRMLAILVVVFSLTYAFSDEFHQRFVPGREGKFSDVAIDAMGICLSIGIIVFLSAYRTRSDETKVFGSIRFPVRK